MMWIPLLVELSAIGATFSPYPMIAQMAMVAAGIMLFATILNIHHGTLSPHYLPALGCDAGAQHTHPLIGGLIYGPFFSWWMALPMACIWGLRVAYWPMHFVFSTPPPSMLMYWVLYCCAGASCSGLLLDSLGMTKNPVQMALFFIQTYNALAYFGGAAFFCTMLVMV